MRNASSAGVLYACNGERKIKKREREREKERKNLFLKGKMGAFGTC